MRFIIRSALVAALAVFVPLLSASCGDSSGTSTGTGAGGSGGGGSGGGGDVAYGASKCGTCVETDACVSQLNACASDPSCAAYLECLDACPLGPSGDADVACEQACPAVSGSAGLAAKSAFIDCRFTGAGYECIECGKLAGPENPIFHQVCMASGETNTCYKCEDENCCDTYEACHTDPDCDALATCAQGCATLECMDQCYLDHTEGFEKFGNRLSCLLYFCPFNDGCGNDPPDPCIKCVNQYCADQNAACAADLQCVLLRDCENPCDFTDAACFTACEQKFPDGVAPLKSTTDCGVGQCEIPCGGSTP